MPTRVFPDENYRLSLLAYQCHFSSLAKIEAAEHCSKASSMRNFKLGLKIFDFEKRREIRKIVNRGSVRAHAGMPLEKDDGQCFEDDAVSRDKI